MADLNSTLTSIILLLGNAALMVVLAFILVNFSFSKSIAARKGLVAKLVFGIALDVLAIYGTLMGTKLPDGTIVNVRELAAMIAGVAGDLSRERWQASLEACTGSPLAAPQLCRVQFQPLSSV